MEVNEIYDLLKKYRENRCTFEEKERIIDWYQQFDYEVEELSEIPRGKFEQLWCSIEKRVNISCERRRIRVISRCVAVAVVLLAVGIIFYFNGRENEDVLLKVVKHELLPANGVAVLELSDGRQVSLAKTEMIQEQEGVLIKNDSAVLDYSLMGEGDVRAVYNTIKVPIGGEYQVVLAGGSRVCLNSCSSLKYPVVFTGEKREVELTGEAYFDVAKGEKPFIVKTPEVDVRVLGTSFNVSSYLEDGLVTTTLVNGQVVLHDRHQQKEYNMTAGMTLLYCKNDGKVKVDEVDPELNISWMHGKFKFEDMRLEDIMVKLNRWYDCQIEYADESLRNLRFSGAAEKDRPASYLLEIIETVTDVEIEIVGKRILVRKK